MTPYVAAASGATRTLPEIVALALGNSATLKIDGLNVEVQRARRDQAGVWPNPLLQTTFGRISDNTIAGPLAEGTLLQTIPFPGKIAAREAAAEADTESADLAYRDRRLRVQHEAVLASYRVAVVSQLAKHVAERKDRFRLLRQFMATRPFASPAQQTEKDLVETKLTFLEEHLVQRESDARAASDALQALLQTPEAIHPVVPWWNDPHPIAIPTPADADVNLDYRRQNAALARARADARGGGLAAWPDFQLGFGFRQEYTADIPVGPTHFYSGYLNVQLPIWDHAQNTRRALDAAQEVERWRLESQRRQLDLARKTRAEALDKARRTVRLFSFAQIPVLHRRAERAEAEFRRTRLPLPLFLEMESQAHETEDRIYEAQLEYAQALSAWRLLRGEDMPTEATR